MDYIDLLESEMKKYGVKKRSFNRNQGIANESIRLFFLKKM